VKATTIQLRTPYPPGHVNGYLFADSPITIVDPGPAVETTVPTWLAALAAHGLQPRQVEQIVLTHQHWDHLGAAQALRERTGARVLAPPGVRRYVTGFAEAMAAEVAYYTTLMRTHDVPEELTTQALAVFAGIVPYVETSELDAELPHGSQLRVGGHTLTVLARPGHSPTDTVFADLEAGVALVGDHLLEEYPSIVMPPVQAPPVPASALLRSGMPEMLDSLRATERLGLSLALPGHGAPVSDIPAAVARSVEFFRRHDAQILDALARGSATAWGLVLSRDPEPRGADALYKLAATLGALEMLGREGRVEQLGEERGAPRFGRAA
jgi:glyoxylase-like metal-dependent hydrolase (beta-lactamase superfamily II)